MRHLFLAALFATALGAAEFSPRKAFFTAGQSKIVFDGRIREKEYRFGMQNFGMLAYNSPVLSTRQGTFYAAMDKKYLYLACRSEVPDVKGVKLLSRYKKRDAAIYKDDCVEFLLLPPGGKGVYHIIVNPSGKIYDVEYPMVNGGVSATVLKDWNPPLEARSFVGPVYWELEVRIPRSALGLADFRKEEIFKMQFARTWHFPNQQCQLNQATIYVNPEEMCTVKFQPEVPVVRFTTMGKYRQGKNNLTFVVDNPTDRPRTVAHVISVTSEAAPRSADGMVVVPPRSSVPVVLNYEEKAKLNSEMNVLFTDKATGAVLYQRCLGWQYPVGSRWNAPVKKSDCPLEFGVYPYLNTVRARIGSTSSPMDLRKVASVHFQLTDKSGKPAGAPMAGKLATGIGYTVELPMNLTRKDEYFLQATIKGTDGKITVKKERFKFEKFPWEHNQLGRDRIVLPPYTPLKYGPTSVKTLMGEYTFHDGFFSAIRMGKAENLLVAPVTLKVNGQSLRQNRIFWGEKAADQCQVTMTADDNQATYAVTHHLEFDNFIKTALKITPKNGLAKISDMTLDIPLQTQYGQMIHSTCNFMRYNISASFFGKGDGVLWNSMQGKINLAVSNNFRPYIWVGNMAEGLAFFAENDRHWSRNPKKPMAELIRKGEATILRIHLADTAVTYTAPVTLVFGFQATPTRPRPAHYQQISERWKAPNSIAMACFAGGACWSCDHYDFYPKDHDYSFINALSKAKNQQGDPKVQNAICQAFLKKHFSGESKDRQDFILRHLQRGFAYANISTHIFPYLNARATHLHWPEYQVFMDEWFCAQFRANNEDDYNNSPVPSYQDYTLFCMHRLIKEGLDGIYFDNIRDWNSPNAAMGPAYELPNGKLQPYFDLFDMRNYIKRTAIMLHKEHKTLLDNRPLFVLHCTNTNIVPFTSLGTVSLDMEAHYGSADFQERFSEDYLKIGTLGLQCGAAPEVLVQITGNNREHVTRTFLAVTLAYDLPAVMNVGGLTSSWHNIWRKLKTWGYGTDGVQTYPCFEPSGRLSCDNKDVRLTEYRRQDGVTIIAVSSYGAAGNVRLQLPKGVSSAANFETGAAVPVNSDGSCTITLKKNEFQLIEVK